MRWNVQLIDCARACASVVLPTPGTSSTSRCPPARSVTAARRTASAFPRMTLSTAARRRATRSAASATDSAEAASISAG